MDDVRPYTSAEEDPFRMVHSWVQQQCSAYLAYPDIPTAPHVHDDDSASMMSYDLVEDDDIPKRSSRLSTMRLLFNDSTKRRPSVLAHFTHPSRSSLPDSDLSSPSRPSISSSADTNDTGLPHTPSKVSLFDSIRLRGHKPSRSTSTTCSAASSSSLRLSNLFPSDDPSTKQPRRAPFASKSPSALDNIDDEDDDALDHPTYRFTSHSSRPPIPYLPPPTSTLPRGVQFSSLNSRSHRKKKKLVISGIGATETRKLDGVKRWCESFGQVRSINRMPNGDLQVDFRDPEVADTVCRVRAKVFITGVGSVQLSWIAGSKR